MRALLSALLVLAAIAPSQPCVAAGDYVGSEACEGCHTYIFQNWQMTRHGATVMTAAEARAAGYPLPAARRGGKALSIHSWDDVGYVIGRRKRFAYVDSNGNVQDSGYHQRLRRWDLFPTGKMTDCAACHFTGPGSGKTTGPHSEITGNWTELAVGCEACHGPGARHVQSLSRNDTTVDSSPRVCGGCHTSAGNVLPEDDRQDMHDLVQVWNHDAHATGTRFNTYSAFCAECHAPFMGKLTALPESFGHPVFTEQKDAIGCIGCHNPHELTSEQYRQPTIKLQTAVPPRLHTYSGNDRDFTTTDFQEHDGMEALCLQCHRGADRVDLDHANASCIDCHNSYHRNRTLESRVVHDARRPGLSCQPCHRDADHLLTILYEDAEFLAPRHIHNLGSLPELAKQKYKLHFSGRDFRQGHGAAAFTYGGEPVVESASAAAPATTSGVSLAAVPERLNRQAQAVAATLAREPHLRLARDGAIRTLQEGLANAPGLRAPYLALAAAYAKRGEPTADIVELALVLDAPGIFLDPAFVARAGFEPPQEQAGMDPRAFADLLLPGDGVSARGLAYATLVAYLQIQRADFDAAVESLNRALDVRAATTTSALYLGLAELGRESYPAAVASLQRVLAAEPGHVTARLGFAVALLGQDHFHQGRGELQRVLEQEPANAVAHYLLGRAYLLRGDAEKAVVALQSSLAADAGQVEVWLQFARSQRGVGNIDAAVRIYREILARLPADFDSRFELASLLKLAGDAAAFQLQAQREARRPTQLSAAGWRRQLDALERSSSTYSQLALSEFALAQRLRPADRRIIQQVGDIYRRSGNLDRAHSQFGWLAAREPQEWLYHYRLGIVLIEQERYIEAIDVLARAVAISPAQGDAYFALGLAQVRADRFEDALHTFRKGTQWEPFNPALYTNLGATAAHLGRYGPARAALQRSLALASFPLPRVHLTHTNLALVQLAQGRREEAVISLKRALHAYPGYVHARTLLIRLESGEAVNKVGVSSPDAFVFNDLLARFGEVTTVTFADE